MKKILPILISIVLFFSCHKRQNDYAHSNVASVKLEEEIAFVTRESPGKPAPPAAKIEKQEVNKKKIIKDGQLGILVTELQKTKNRVDSLVKKHSGYYSNESFNNSDEESSFNLTVRIPCTNFEIFIAEVESGDGEILNKEIEARDVTDQFIDLETRLANKKNYLVRYNLLLNHAKTVKDILEIEEKIRGLEEEVESTTGKLKYLNDQVDYSTLILTIAKQKEFQYNPAKRDKFSERMKQSLSKGWIGFVDLMLFVVKIWPFWILLALALYGWRKYKKSKKKE